MKRKEVYPCGTHITSVIGNVNGIITAVSIRFSAVSYEVSYFLDNEYKTAWLNESEFTTSENKKESIGFKQHK